MWRKLVPEFSFLWRQVRTTYRLLRHTKQHALSVCLDRHGSKNRHCYICSCFEAWLPPDPCYCRQMRACRSRRDLPCMVLYSSYYSFRKYPFTQWVSYASRTFIALSRLQATWNGNVQSGLNIKTSGDAHFGCKGMTMLALSICAQILALSDVHGVQPCMNSTWKVMKLSLTQCKTLFVEPFVAYHATSPKKFQHLLYFSAEFVVQQSETTVTLATRCRIAQILDFRLVQALVSRARGATLSKHGRDILFGRETPERKKETSRKRRKEICYTCCIGRQHS